MAGLGNDCIVNLTHTMIEKFLRNVISYFNFLKSVRLLNQFFNSRTLSQILYFRMPVSDIIPFLEVELFNDVHLCIQSAEHIDLVTIDNQLDQGAMLKDIVDVTAYQKLRSLMKLGYLIKDIRENGQLNPIQLILGSAPNKYFVHPGSVRILVLAYILENTDLINIIYCWDKTLDPSPLAFNYDFTPITCTRDFLILFNKIKNNKFFVQTITHSSELTIYSKLQSTLLRNRCKQQALSYDFLTMFYTWDPNIEHLVRFKDIIQFESTHVCFISGVKFKKINKVWVKV